MATSQAQCAQRGDGAAAVVLDGVGDGEHARPAGRRRRRSIGGLARRAASRSRSAAGRLASMPLSMQQCRGADQHGVPVDGGLHARAGDRLRSPSASGSSMPAACGAARRWPRRGGARTVASRRRRPGAVARLRRSAPAASTSVSGGLAVGDGAGLVEHDGVEFVRGLQGLAARDQDAALGALAGADHDRSGGGEARARTGRR